MNDLIALEQIILEDLLDPEPNRCQDTALLLSLQERGLVAHDGERWVLTIAGLRQLTKTMSERLSADRAEGTPRASASAAE